MAAKPWTCEMDLLTCPLTHSLNTPLLHLTGTVTYGRQALDLRDAAAQVSHQSTLRQSAWQHVNTTPYQHNPSIHPIHSLYQHTISIPPINTPDQPILPTNSSLFNHPPTHPPTLSPPPLSLCQQSLLTDVGALLWTLSVAFARSTAGVGVGVGVDNTASVYNPRMLSPMLAAVVFPVQLGEVAGAVGWPPPTILALQQLLTPIEVCKGEPIQPYTFTLLPNCTT